MTYYGAAAFCIDKIFIKLVRKRETEEDQESGVGIRGT